MSTAQIRDSLAAANGYIDAQSALLDAVRLGEAMAALADNIATQISNIHGDVSELTDLLGDINQSSFSATARQLRRERALRPSHTMRRQEEMARSIENA